MKNSNYQANLLKREKCILCNWSNIFTLFKNSEYAMAKCRNCGLLYQFPQVSKDKYMKNIQKHYSEVDPSFGVAYSRKRLYKRFLNQIEHIKRKNARLLDVGCGLGYFLSLARNQGWNVYGIEPNLDIVKKGSQNFRLDIQCAAFEESNFPSDYFDVITLWNVFDELFNPSGCILKIRKILKPSGVLYIRIPNAAFHLFIYKIQQTLKKLHLTNIMPYQSFIFHIFSFSAKTLKWILSNNGFYNIKIKNSWPTSGDPYGGKKGVGILKKTAFLIGRFIFILTWGKQTVAPSIEVFAKNAKT